MINISLLIAYDGTDYLGWQETKMGKSIEEELKNVLMQVLQEKIILQAASRTDAGVHAEGQVVNFFSKKHSLDPKKLKYILNRLLPKSIVIRDAKIEKDTFHPTLDCIKKEYHYHIGFGPYLLPKNRNFCWHYPYVLNRKKMQESANFLIGNHDFLAFTNKPQKNCRRTISRLDILDIEKESLRIEIEADRFLYRMARILVGTLTYVGRYNLDTTFIKNILEKKERKHAKMTAPAHGLVLKNIFY